MSYAKTSAYKKIKNLSSRIRIIQGGTSASKTVSIMLYLIASAQCDTSPTLTSVVAESFPHLRRGAMRDFLMIMKEHGYFKDSLWDRTNSVYNFETSSQIEFFSVDQPEKVRGARRDRLFINEANNVSKDSFDELEVRTKDFIFIDYNPTNEFWGMEIRAERTDTEFIILTYIDNEALDQAIVNSIEQRRNRAGWWQVYGLGQLGEVEGKIYRRWQIIDSIPHEARLERFGLDFGYSNDPSALVAIYYYNGGYIIDECVFQKGLSNKQLADLILNQPRKALTIADSAEPKSIDEIRSYGIMIQPTVKGKDSVRQGIQMVQDQAVSVTKQSVNVIKEYRNYLWETDKEGRILNEPEHTWSHSMDAIRYGMSSLIPAIQRREFASNMPRYEVRDVPNPAR